MKTVEIDIKGGMVYGIDVPEGVTVKIRDFDTEGGDPDAHDLRKDTDGEEYYERIYEHGDEC